MNLNKKIGYLLDKGFKPNFISNLNESKINFLFEKFSKKENKEAVTTNVQKTTYSASEAKGKSFPGVTTINPDGSITVTKEGEMKEDDSEENLNWVMKGRTQQPKQVGPDTDDGFDDYDDGTGQISEKFESKAQQGLFWARCNKCKSENCKWCKMAKEFSKSTSKKQYKTMPEKKHPEKTVKYKKKTTTKKETKEDFSFGDYNEKIASVTANSLKSGMMRHKPMPIFSESELEKKFEKIIENNLLPSMKKRDLLMLSESEIKRKKGLSEDNHKKGSMSTETEIKPPKTKQPPKTDNPFKIKPGIKTPPKAKKDFNGEIEEASMSGTETAPTIKPPKEKEKEKAPGRENPFAPKPGVKPKPKAKSDDSVPQWLSFGSLTDKY